MQHIIILWIAAAADRGAPPGDVIMSKHSSQDGFIIPATCTVTSQTLVLLFFLDEGKKGLIYYMCLFQAECKKNVIVLRLG